MAIPIFCETLYAFRLENVISTQIVIYQKWTFRFRNVSLTPVKDKYLSITILVLSTLRLKSKTIKSII